jgi:hypothetical protein
VGGIAQPNNFNGSSQRKDVVMKHNIITGMSRGKQMIYRYNGDPSSDEVVSDRTGRMPLCWVGEMLRRNGKEWLVACIRYDLDMVRSARAVPIHRIFLTDKF